MGFREIRFMVMKLIPVIAQAISAVVAAVAMIWSQGHNFAGAEENPEPAAAEHPVEMDEEAWLKVIAGNWVSATGEQKATIEGRKIRFTSAKHWPDLEGGIHLLGQHLTFQTNEGSYSLLTSDEDHDWIDISTYNIHADSLSFVLYREGTKFAGSRKPLPETAPPAKVQAILDKIPTVKAGEHRDAVMKRLGLDQDGSLEHIEKQQDSGQTYELINLKAGDEWMLELIHGANPSENGNGTEGVYHCKVIRGSVKDQKEGEPDYQYRVFPYLIDGRIITGPSDSRKADAMAPAAQPNRK